MADYTGSQTGAEIDDAVAATKGATTGIMVKTGTGTGARRTVTGTTDEITVTNGNGVSGNPTLSLATAVTHSLALANTAVLVGVALALLPLLVGVFDAPIHGSLPLLFLTVLLGCGALAAPGTLYGLITSQARGSSVLLPLLLFPLVVPALLAVSNATTKIFEGDPMNQAPSWIALVAAFDAVHWSLSAVLYGRIQED